MGSPYGHAIADDLSPRYFSASSLTTADPNSYGGCLRSWWYKYRDGKRPEETAAMKRGTMMHSAIETSLKTGVRAFPPFVLPGAHYIPAPHPSYGIELEIARPLGVIGPIDFARAPLRAGGVPIVGKIDLRNPTGMWLDRDGDWRNDGDGVTEIKDWKSTAGLRYAKTGDELRETIQNLTYAAWEHAVTPGSDRVRLTNAYFVTGKESGADLATTLVDREHVARKWQYIESLARSVSDVSKETDAAKVEPQPKSCNAYGRNGCPHKSYCPSGKYNALESVFGAGSSSLITPTTQARIIEPMSLLNKLRPAGTPAPVTAPTPAAPAATIGGNALIAALQAEEAAAIAQQAPTPAPAAPTLTAEQTAAFAVISRAVVAGFGSPTFRGVAAQLYAVTAGQSVAEGTVYPGSGKIASIMVDTEAELIKTANDLAAYLAAKDAATPTPAPAAVAAPAPTVSALPPDAPASNPAIASKPVDAAPANVVAANPGAAVDTATVAAAAVAATAATTATTSEPPAKPRRGRPPGSGKKPQAEQPAGTSTAPADDDEALVIYVDCMPSTPFESMQPLIDGWLAQIVAHFEPPMPDVRCGRKGEKSEPLAFGNWRGIVASVTEDQVKTMPRASYVLITKGSEINTEIAAALTRAGTVDQIVRAL